MINKFKKQSGFTILESLVAIFILSVAISGVFAVVQSSLSKSIIAKDEVKAYYLAQEGLELIRNKRDSNQLNKIANPTAGITWLTGMAQHPSDPCHGGKICRVDARDMTFVHCAIDYNDYNWYGCLPLNQNATTYLYAYTSGADWNTTYFKREIQFEIINANEIVVTVRVFWKKGDAIRNFKAKTVLFNWIPPLL